MGEVGVSGVGDAPGEDLLGREGRKEGKVWAHSQSQMNPTIAASRIPTLANRPLSMVQQSSELVCRLTTMSKKISKPPRDHPHKRINHNSINPTGTIIMFHLYGAILLRKMYFL